MTRSNRNLRAALLALFVLAAVAIGLLTAVQPLRNLLTPPAEQYRAEGDAFLADGRLAEAVLSYRQALSADPDNQAARASLAEAYTSQGRLRTAAALLDAGQAISLAQPPVDPSARLAPAWIIRPALAVPTGAAIQDNLLVVAYEDGTLAAVALPSGQLVWSVTLSQTTLSAPEAGGGLVFVGEYNGLLHALSAQDGSPRWNYPTGGPLFAAPLLSGQALYLPSSDGSLYALNSQDGSLSWQFTAPGALHGSPAVSDGVVYLGSNDGRLYALSAENGAPVWQEGIQTNGAVESRPVIAGGRVIFGSADGRVYALAPESGGQYWRYSTPDGVYASPLVAGDVVYIASAGHTLSAVDFTSGDRIWELELATALRSPPVLTGQRLLQTADADPHLYWIDAESGQVMAAVDTGDWTAGGPWLVGDMLYLLGKDGAVLAYRLP